MNRFCLFCVMLVFSGTLLFAADWSGVLDSTVNYTAGAGDAPDNSFGIEQYANLRLRVRAREIATFHAAFNLIALSGNFALPAVYSGLALEGPNYAAAMELERLYVRMSGEHLDSELGLLRMNFGYSQVWASSDFINPVNPLAYNARPRGVLGLNASIYPTDTTRLMGFVAAPRNPLETEGAGFLPGLVMDQHWSRASLQALYAYETALDATPGGLHRFGLSIKADLELGFVVDALFTLNPDDIDGINGLSAGLGFDYSFFGGDLYVLAEYLYNGSSSVSAHDSGGNWQNNHYLYGSALYRFNDFFTMSLGTFLCLDDMSFLPIISADYELFQGFTLNISARLPLDQKTLNDGRPGELGPIPPLADGSEGAAGASFVVNAGAKLRF